jgi:hypothetical protein
MPSKTKPHDNPNDLPTIEDALAGIGLTLVAEDVPAPAMPSWVEGNESTPMPSALVEELAALHAEKRAAEAVLAEIEGRRANLFRGFLIGTGLSLTAQYDLSTGQVTVPEQD